MEITSWATAKHGGALAWGDAGHVGSWAWGVAEDGGSLAGPSTGKRAGFPVQGRGGRVDLD